MEPQAVTNLLEWHLKKNHHQNHWSILNIKITSTVFVCSFQKFGLFFKTDFVKCFFMYSSFFFFGGVNYQGNSSELAKNNQLPRMHPLSTLMRRQNFRMRWRARPRHAHVCGHSHSLSFLSTDAWEAARDRSRSKEPQKKPWRTNVTAMCFQAESSNREANCHTSYPLICAAAAAVCQHQRATFPSSSVIVPKANRSRAAELCR